MDTTDIDPVEYNSDDASTPSERVFGDIDPDEEYFQPEPKLTESELTDMDPSSLVLVSVQQTAEVVWEVKMQHLPFLHYTSVVDVINENVAPSENEVPALADIPTEIVVPITTDDNDSTIENLHEPTTKKSKTE